MRPALANVVDLHIWRAADIRRFTVDNVHFSPRGFDEVTRILDSALRGVTARSAGTNSSRLRRFALAGVMTYYPCRHSGGERPAWDVTGHHRAGPDDHVVTDDTRADHRRSGSEKASAPDLDIPALGWDLVKRGRIVQARHDGRRGSDGFR